MPSSKTIRWKPRNQRRIAAWRENHANWMKSWWPYGLVSSSKQPRVGSHAWFVAKMTNAERNAWARAGYPGLKHKEVEPLRPYVGRLLNAIKYGVAV